MNLFDQKELSRADRMRKSRKITTDLTKDAVEYINSTGQFHVTRANNIPSYRTQKVTKFIEGYDKDGKPCQYPYDTVEIHHKAKNIKEAILDIQGFRTNYGDHDPDKMPGQHFEAEVKVGKDELSPEQLERIDKLKKAGAVVFVFNNMETLKLHLSKHLKPYQAAF